jgi:uncharacterized protein YaaW (UPF0174 family)
MGKSTRQGSWHRVCTYGLSCIAALTGAVGCSLISLKSPEKPLSTQDLNTRILTREQTSQFRTAVERCAQNIVNTEQNQAVLENGLRWEIAALSASRSAETQLAPKMSLLDSWALAVQMRGFVAEGAPGGALFGTHQATVREISDAYADGTEALAKRLLSADEYNEYQSFVTAYARDYPLHDLSFDRPSVVELWSRDKGGATKLVDSLGTIPEAMEDTAQRLQIYGDTTPVEAMRTTQLAMLKAGYSRQQMQAALKQLDERLDRLMAVAETAPELVHDAEDQFRQSLREVLDRLDAESNSMTATLQRERAALFANLQDERVAVVAAVDEQRKALAQDASRISDQVVKNSGAQLRRLAAEVVLLLLVLSIVLLGLPFAAGYLVGRARQRRGPV